MLEKYAHVFPAMVTPMNEDGSFNYEVAKKHADWMMDNGIGGIGVLMAAGEYQSMSLEEHMEYVNIMVPYIKIANIAYKKFPLLNPGRLLKNPFLVSVIINPRKIFLNF